MSEKSTLEGRIKSFQDGRANLDEVRSLAAQIGDENCVAGAPILVQLLRHGDAIVRYHAAASLGFELKFRPATDVLASMLLEDGDEDCRDMAAGSLRILWKGSRDRRIIELLASAARHDHDEEVRRAAYFALIVVYGIPSEDELQILTTGRPPVDLDHISSILSELRH